ncbi:MAG TPA: hypothetical protein VMZ92_07045 [Planctomycetota bacterium]|nr:hypothetical protein [Planctomycetota bacterium]
MNTETHVERGVRDFLDRVAEHLGAVPEDEKREILTDLASHIHEALASRVSEREPTLADLEQVLAEMDPPESYAPQGDVEGAAGSDRRTIGIAALCTSLGSLLAAGLLAVLADTRLPFFLLVVGQVAALGLGILSRSSPFGKAAIITSSALLVLSVLFAV